MTRVVSVLEVADPAVWDELERVAPLAGHLGETLGARRIVLPSFEKEVLPRLRESGVPVLIRYARRGGDGDPATSDAAERVARLSRRARSVLETAQRHTIDGMVIGIHAWDPLTDGPAVRELLGAGVITLLEGDAADRGGRYTLDPDLPLPPEIPYTFDDAVMPEPDDLQPASPGPVGLLHDLASLAAAIDHVRPKRTQAGQIGAVDARKLGTRLAIRDVRIEDDPRWARALRGLEALGVVAVDPMTRELGLDLGLENTLAGTTEQAIDRLIHKLVEADLHSAVPAVRAALRQAGDGALDEIVFFDLVFEQHRDVLFAPWRREEDTYPMLEGDSPRPFDREGFDAVEVPMLKKLLSRLDRLGILRRAPGVFAGTPDGRRWARVDGLPLPPVWVSSDLEVVVPPDGVTPWERFQLERLGRCIVRDVVDRYRLERAGIETWLRFHELEEAIALLRRRSPAVPHTAIETLTEWARSASRIVLLRGVLLP